jgi:hypothetical protein
VAGYGVKRPDENLSPRWLCRGAFADIERLAKELRRRLDQVAETVRIVAAELGQRTTMR